MSDEFELSCIDDVNQSMLTVDLLEHFFVGFLLCPADTIRTRNTSLEIFGIHVSFKPLRRCSLCSDEYPTHTAVKSHNLTYCMHDSCTQEPV